MTSRLCLNNFVFCLIYWVKSQLCQQVLFYIFNETFIELWISQILIELFPVKDELWSSFTFVTCIIELNEERYQSSFKMEETKKAQIKHRTFYVFLLKFNRIIGIGVCCYQIPPARAAAVLQTLKVTAQLEADRKHPWWSVLFSHMSQRCCFCSSRLTPDLFANR